MFDVLRARVVTVDAQSLLALLDLLRGGTLELELEALPGSGQPGTVKRVVLNLVRLKNKFAPSHMDPTHFRNVICNIELEYGQSRVMFELQFHHRDILEYNTVSHAHAHYEYFRVSFSGCQATNASAWVCSLTLRILFVWWWRSHNLASVTRLDWTRC